MKYVAKMKPLMFKYIKLTRLIKINIKILKLSFL